MRFLAFVALLGALSVACGASRSAGDTQQGCVGDGGTFVCDDQIFPGCTSQDMTGSCEIDAGTCMGCIGSSPAGYVCSCQPNGSGDGRGTYLCAGTGGSCTLTP